MGDIVIGNGIEVHRPIFSCHAWLITILVHLCSAVVGMMIQHTFLHVGSENMAYSYQMSSGADSSLLVMTFDTRAKFSNPTFVGMSYYLNSSQFAVEIWIGTYITVCYYSRK